MCRRGQHVGNIHSYPKCLIFTLWCSYIGVSHVVKLTGVLHIQLSVQQLGLGRELYSNCLACIGTVVSAMLMVSGCSAVQHIASRDSENGEELPEGSDQLSSASMEGKHGCNTGHGESKSIPVKAPSEVQVRSFGSDTATVDGLLPWVPYPTATWAFSVTGSHPAQHHRSVSNRVD